MPSLTKWKVVPPGRSHGSRLVWVTTKTGVWNGASSGQACSPRSNMRLPMTLAPVLGIEYNDPRVASRLTLVADHVLYGVVVAGRLAPEPEIIERARNPESQT